MKTLPALLVLVLAAAAPAQKMSSTAAPDGEHLLISLSAKGVQIYTCKQVNANTQWVFEGPEATLSNAKGEAVGTHVAGPIWKYLDGSQVTAEVVATSEAPVANSIPWLLLHATTVASYLKGDWFRDWGALQRLTPYYPDAQPARLELGTETRGGLWQPAPLRKS